MALPFNSDFDGKMVLFACVPLSGETLLHNKATHALVHDRTDHFALHRTCAIPSRSSMFVAVESMWHGWRPHSVPRDFEIMNALFPVGNAQLVDEAHAMGLRTACSPGCKRSYIRHRSLNNAAIIAASCFFDDLEDSTTEKPTSDISDDDMTLDGATANTDPIAFDSSPPWHLCLLPRAWAQCTVRKYTTTVIKLNLPSESPSGTSAAGPPSSKACHAVDHLSNPFDNSPTAYAAYTPLPPVLRDPRTGGSHADGAKAVNPDEAGDLDVTYAVHYFEEIHAVLYITWSDSESDHTPLVAQSPLQALHHWWPLSVER
ncbi:hypothetical protein F5888DRAFT_1858178 [Russula emetica]|nr:hypothetical protein F5888DRAFT_1858178 [Russula emetica]